MKGIFGTEVAGNPRNLILLRDFANSRQGQIESLGEAMGSLKLPQDGTQKILPPACLGLKLFSTEANVATCAVLVAGSAAEEYPFKLEKKEHIKNPKLHECATGSPFRCGNGRSILGSKLACSEQLVSRLPQ